MKSTQIKNSALDIFSLPPTDVSYTTSRHGCVHPVYSVQQKDVPIEFTVTGDKLHWIDLSKSYIYARLKIIQKDGSNLPGTAQIAPLNLILHTLWDECELTINGSVISKSNTNYAYKAYIEKQILQGAIAKENVMQQELYIKEKNIGSFEADSLSYQFLNGLCKESKSFEVIGTPMESFFLQKRLLPPCTDLRLKFRRKSDKFVLKGPELSISVMDFPYELVIDEMTFHPHLNLINPEVHARHIKRMAKGEKAKYIFPVSLIKSYSIPAGSTSYLTSDIFSQEVPQYIIVGLVDSAAFHGNFSKNPFNFEDFGLLSINVTVEGLKSFSKKIEVGGLNSEYLTGYNSLFSVLHDPETVGNQISREDYLNGNFFIAFNFKNIMESNEEFIIPDGQGRVSMELTFKSGLLHVTQLVVYGKFQSIATIDHRGSVNFME